MLAVNQRSNFDPGSKIPLFEAIQPSKWNNRFIRSYVTRGSVQVSLTHIGAPLSRTNAGRVSIFSIYCLHLPRPRTKGDASKNFTSATWKKGMDEKERQCGWQKEKEKRGGEEVVVNLPVAEPVRKYATIDQLSPVIGSSYSS